jgi:hypothetical protein
MTIRSRTAKAVLKRTATEVRYPKPGFVELSLSAHEAQLLRQIAQYLATDGDELPINIAEAIQFAGWLVRKL